MNTIVKTNKKSFLLFSIGNKKIGKDTMIINIDSATNCKAGKMGLCSLFQSNKCYAMKSERQYPQVLPYRTNQAIIWDKYSSVQIANEIININKKKRNKIKFLRLNESGDFKNQSDVFKISIIAELLKADGIKVYTYTHRKDLNFESLSDNLTINSSWQDTKIHNRFLSFPKNTVNRIMRMKKDKKIVACRMDCSICNICKFSNNLTVLCNIH